MTATHKHSSKEKVTGKVPSGFATEKSQGMPTLDDLANVIEAGRKSLRRKVTPDMTPLFLGQQGSSKRNDWNDIVALTVWPSGVERHNIIQHGLSTSLLVVALHSFKKIPEVELLHAIGLSNKTISRREEARLGPRHSDAAMALIEVTDMANRVLGSRELAENWLTQPALALDGQRPLDLISSNPGIEAVKDLLTRMEYGVYA